MRSRLRLVATSVVVAAVLGLGNSAPADASDESPPAGHLGHSGHSSHSDHSAHSAHLPMIVYPEAVEGEAPPPEPGFAPLGPVPADPLGLVVQAPHQRGVSLGTDRVAVVVCQVPADTTDPFYDFWGPSRSRDAESVAAWAAESVSPWFHEVSGGRYIVEFAARDAVVDPVDGGAVAVEEPSVIELGPTDGPRDCYDQAVATTGAPYTNVLAIDTSSYQGGLAGPGWFYWDSATQVASGATLTSSPSAFERGAYIGGGVAGIGDDLGVQDWPMIAIHEIGHTLHWPHSFVEGAADQYTNPVDIMSGLDIPDNVYCEPEPGSFQPCRSMNTIAFNRYVSGWIEPSEVAVLEAGTQEVSLRAMGTPGTQMAVVPVDDVLVTLEARIDDGLDAALDVHGVAVHVIDQRDASCPEKDASLLGTGCFSLWRRQGPALGTPRSWEHVILPGQETTVHGVGIEVTAAVAGGYEVRVDIAPTPPTAPRNVVAVAADARASVSWDAPARSGGSPVIRYTATATPEGRSCTTTGARTCTIRGLTNGASYRVSVTAANAVGVGPASAVSDPVVPQGTGYWMASASGRVYGFGSSPSNAAQPAPTVAIASGPSGTYWLLHADGRVTARGGAAHHGDARAVALRPGERFSTIAGHPDGRGYWIFTTLGRVVTRGTVSFHGDMSAVTLNGPVVDSVATPTGNGYYMVGSDGGVFTFGDARFRGSTGGLRLNEPVVGLVPTSAGTGYWLVAADGGVFAFGAPFRGSVPGALPVGARLNRPVIGALAYGNGYVMVASDGGAFVFSDAPFLGSLGGSPPPSPIVDLAVRRG
ncbi:MAG: fibronectin type III domain-containing protein [Acidimicrobiales bacterium]